MAAKKYLLIEPILQHYKIDIQLITEFQNIGRIELVQENETFKIPEDQVSDLQKMIRLTQELHINPEGIDAVLELLERMEAMQERMQKMTERLMLWDENWEDDF